MYKLLPLWRILFFFFNDTATTEIYTLSLHDALPIYLASFARVNSTFQSDAEAMKLFRGLAQVVVQGSAHDERSEEHTSELQSPCNLVCRLLLEKKNNSRRRYS